jgi:chromosome segregation ATPase
VLNFGCMHLVLDVYLLCNCSEMERLTDANAHLEHDKRQTMDDVARLVQQNNAVASEINGKDRRCANIQRELQAIESGESNATKFGEKVPNILNQISRTSFRGPVVGPIGMCVAMRDGCDKWSYALEQSLFNPLKSFIVTTVEDRNTLYGILRKEGAANYNPIILQHAGARMVADNLGQPEQFPTIAEVLQVNDDLAFNALLDQGQIDRVGLAEKDGDIALHLKEHVNGQDKLRYGLLRVVTPNAITLSYRQGNQSSEVPSGPHRHMLAKDTTVYAAALRNELTTLRQEIAELQAQQRELYQRKNAGDAEISRKSKTISENGSAIKMHSKRRNDAEAELDTVQANSRIDTSDMERELTEQRAAIDQLSFHIQQEQDKLDALTADIRHAKAEEAAAEREKREIEDQLDRVTAAFEKLVTKRSDALKRKDALQADHDRKVRDLAAKQSELAAAVEGCNQKVAVAEEKTRDLIEGWDGQPVPLHARDTKAIIERRVAKLRADWEEGMRKVNLAGYTHEVLAERLSAARTAYATIKSNFLEASSNTDEVIRYKEEMTDRWEKSYRNALAKTNSAFQQYAQRQGAAGQVIVDQVKEEMKMVVLVDATDANSKQTDVSQLSGGERSYITLCLLLALGHVVSNSCIVL